MILFKRWEYLELSAFDEDMLNDLGEQGWEVVKADRHESFVAGQSWAWALLRRRKGKRQEPVQKTLDDRAFRLGRPTAPVWDAYELMVAGRFSEAVRVAASAEKRNGCHWFGRDSLGGKAFLPMLRRARDEADASGDAEALSTVNGAIAELRSRYGDESCEAAHRWMVGEGLDGMSIYQRDAMKALGEP